MKKIVGILAAAAVATSAFAVDFSANAQAGIKFASDGFSNSRSGEHIGTDDILSFSASTDVAGGNVGLRAKDDKGNASITGSTGDNRLVYVDSYNVWVKPVSVLKLTMGTGADFKIFGDGVGYGDGKIGIINDGTGIKAELTPVEGLWIGGRYTAPNSNAKYRADVEGNMSWEVGASYTIDGIGKIGAEFAREGQNGSSPRQTVDYKWNAAMVGFQLTAVENLNVTVDWAGWFFNSSKSGAYTESNTNITATADNFQKIGDFVTYKLDALTLELGDRILLRSYADKANSWSDANSEFGNSLCAKVAYTINAFTLSAKFGWNMNVAESCGDEFQARVSAYDKPYKGNTLKATLACDYKVGAANVGAEFTVREYDSAMTGNAESSNFSKTTWELPITFKYAF